MAFFEWEEKYNIDIEIIDNQHKKLVDLLNQLHEAMSIGKGTDIIKPVLIGLIEYVKTHFSTEEDLLKKYGYPEYEPHKMLHEKFTDQVRDLKDKYMNGETATLSIETSNFLKDWLVKHIMGADKGYAPFLRDKGVS